MLIFLVDLSYQKPKEANYQVVSLFKGSYCTPEGNMIETLSAFFDILDQIIYADNQLKNNSDQKNKLNRKRGL